MFSGAVCRGSAGRQCAERGKGASNRRRDGIGAAAIPSRHGVNFNLSDHVFIKSALAIDFAYRNATVTLPLFRGLSPQGQDVFYIVTDASDFEVAHRMGVNYAPKLAEAIGSPGVQNVTLEDGIMKFVGNVDFSPEYKVVAGDPPGYFPPKVANPGAVADDKWSSIVVLPGGLVLNAQIVANASGHHLRVKAIDTEARTVTLSILDGVQGGNQYFYHLVTDASVPIAAVTRERRCRATAREDSRVWQISAGGEVGPARFLAGAQRPHRQGLRRGPRLLDRARQRRDRSDQRLSDRSG